MAIQIYMIILTVHSDCPPLEEVVCKLHSTMWGKSLWIFFLGVQLHFTIDQQKIICRATNNAYMNMQTIENAYMMPATSAAQRAFNAHPNFVVFINGSSYNLCSFPVYNNLLVVGMEK